MLFGLFVWLAARGAAAAGFCWLLAWGLDAVDGWLARQLGQETAFGYLFDKVTDRVVLIGGALVALTLGGVPWAAVVWLFSKDIVLALPALQQVRRRELVRSLGSAGKVLALGQGVAVWWLLAGWSGGVEVAAAVGTAGLAAALWHLARFLRAGPVENLMGGRKRRMW